MNHSPPRTEHHGPSAQELSVAASPRSAWWGGSLSSWLDVPNTPLQRVGEGTCQLEEAHQGPGATSSCSNLRFGILFSHSAQDYRPEPSQRPITVLRALPTSLPVDTLAEAEPSRAQLTSGFSRRVTKEGLEKEKPLKIVTCPVYAIKGHKKMYTIGSKQFPSAVRRCPGELHTLHIIRCERSLLQCLQVLCNKKSLCRNDRFHVHLYFQSWALLVQIFQKYSFCLFLDSFGHRLLCYKPWVSSIIVHTLCTERT